MDVRKDEEGVAEALGEIATWYSAEQATRAEPVVPAVNDRPATSAPGLRPRLALVAAVLIAATGAVGLIASRSSNELASSDPAAGLDPTTVLDLCLDIETGYELDPIRTSGTSRQFGNPDSGEAQYILTSGSLHVACGLAQRDNGDWVRVTSLADIHLPLRSADDTTVLVAVGLRDRIYIAGQVGPDVDSIEVERAAGNHAALIDDGWWGVSFDAIDDLNSPFPPFTVRWTTTSGDTSSATGSELLPDKPWNLCAQDTACRTSRLVELHELAKGSGATEQAAILADGIVTADELRAAMRTWGECIAESTGATVTFDNDGIFTIHESGDQIDTEFERCKNSHIALVTEATGLSDS